MRFGLGAAVALGCALVVGCGGGGGSGTPPVTATATPGVTPTPTPTPSPTPTPVPTATPNPLFVVNGNTTLTTASTIITLPTSPVFASGTFGGTMTLSLGQFDTGVPLAYSLGDSLPAGDAILNLGRRSAQANTYGQIPILYVTLQTGSSFTGHTTLSSAPSFVFTVPSSGFIVPGQSYWLGLYDAGNPSFGWQKYGGPATPSGNTITIAGSGGLTLFANVTYTFALYPSDSSGALPIPASPVPTASPAPTPTAGSTATPTPVPTAPSIGVTITIPTAAPILLTPAGPFVFPHVGQTQTAVISQSGYGASFVATSTNPNVATASAALSYTGNYVLTVTSKGVGSCEIQMSSLDGGFGTVGVTVTGP